MAFSYNVILSDPNNLETANDGLLVTDLDAALSDWSNYITGLGTLVVQLNIENTLVGRADGGPTTIVSDGTTASGAMLLESSSVYELTTGQHVAGYSTDITIDVDPAYVSQLFLNPDPGSVTAIPRTETDAVSVFRHEVGHGFGIDGYFSPSGTLYYNGAYETRFDSFVQISADGSAWFTGPASEAVYGGPVPLTTNAAPENYYHFANAISDPLGQDLMNGQAFYYGTSYPISNVDLAVLKDIGVPVTSGVGGPLACFAAGTRILTPDGERPVEALHAGDMVLTHRGQERRITRLWRRRVERSPHATRDLVSPVRIRAGAFAPGLPVRDLWLSPDHGVLDGAVLIPVRYLVNGSTIVQEAVPAIEYFHVELEQHDVLLAEGLPVESYLETREAASQVWESHGCAPLKVTGPDVEAARRRLSASFPSRARLAASR